jgi:hypothetical protein
MKRVDRSSKGHCESEAASGTAIAQPLRTLLPTNYRLGAVFVYQLALLHQYEHDRDLRVGLKAFLKAA